MKESFFNKEIKNAKEKRKRLDIKINQIGKVRLVLTIVSFLTFYCLYKLDFFSFFGWYFMAFFGISFYAVALLQKRAKLKRLHILSEIDLWEREVRLLKGDFSKIFDGSSYNDESHVYSSDLDLFGSHSLFQLINRSNTELGQRELADWLKQTDINSIKNIVKKQDAVKELVKKSSWRKEIMLASCQNNISKNSIDCFMKWLMSKPEKLTWVQTFYPFLSISLLFFSPLLFLFNSDIYSMISFFFVTPLGNLIYLHSLKSQRNQLILSLRNNLHLLKSYSTIIALIENEKFTSNYLIELQRKIDNGAEKALKKIRRIGRLFELASLRGISYEPISRNFFFIILNDFFLFDFFILKSSIKWKKTNREKISRWFKSIAKFEAISSISFFSFANDYKNYSEFNDSKNHFIAKNMGHPLIPKQERITNTFEMEDNIMFVTGSNMAGKSTFLRTLGVNIILANIGSPVVADYFSLSLTMPFTYMRMQDSLRNKTSSFKAQLERLKLLISYIKNGENLFFLIDEPFSGTNTFDRHKGAKQLVIFLLNRNVSGLFSTHDTEIASSLDENIKIANFHFASELNNLSLIFDYKIKEGVCKDFNASFLFSQIWN